MSTRNQRRLADAERTKALARANAKLRAEVQDIYAEFDGHCERGAANLERDTGYTVSCKPGCAHCCDQFIIAYTPEVENIVGRHRALVVRLKPELLRQRRLLLELGAGTTNFLDPVAKDDFAARWFDRRISCPFLTKDKMCSIYDARPLACRGYMVANTDPAECGRRPDLSKGEVIGVNVLDVPAMGLAIQRIAFAEEAATQSGNVSMGPLPELLLRAIAR